MDTLGIRRDRLRRKRFGQGKGYGRRAGKRNRNGLLYHISQMHPAEMQRNILSAAKTIAGIVAMAEMLSMIFVIGSSDIGLIDTGTLSAQLASQSMIAACAGGIWLIAKHLEKNRKK